MTARVLVVDDLLPNIKLLEARLSAEYFDVLTAMNGPDALAACVQGRCDIVLLDVMMPGMDGLEVCRRLKANPATAHLPVVLVTALDQPADRVRGLDAGADDFLTKPLDEVALIARVRSLARLKMTLDELRSRCVTAGDMGVPGKLTEAVAEFGPERQAAARRRSRQLGELGRGGPARTPRARRRSRSREGRRTRGQGRLRTLHRVAQYDAARRSAHLRPVALDTSRRATRRS